MTDTPKDEWRRLRSMIVAAAEAHREEIVRLLVKLVQAKSVSPPGDTREVAEICARTARSFTDRVKVVASVDRLPSVLFELGGGGTELLFNTHIDTVPVGKADDWIYDPFSARIEQGVLYGRGCADAKACAAAMIMAGKILSACGVPLHGRLKVTLVADEESGGNLGTVFLIDSKAVNPDLVVIGEITGNKIAIAEKGIFWTKITTYGRTAHASTPWTGENAITKMLAILNNLRRYWDNELRVRESLLVPPASYNIGIVQGGIQINTVPDRCEAYIDRRILPDESLDEACREVERLVGEATTASSDPGVEVEFSNLGPPINTDPCSGLVEVARTVCRDLGLSDELCGYEQASDGRFFVQYGVPIILLGPGRAELAHSPNEAVSLEEVVTATKIYACLAAKLLGNFEDRE